MTGNESSQLTGVLSEIHACREELASLVAWKEEQRRNIDRFYQVDWRVVIDRIAGIEKRMALAETRLLELRDLPVDVQKIEARQDEIERWRVKVAVYATIGASAGGLVASLIVAIATAIIARMLT